MPLIGTIITACTFYFPLFVYAFPTFTVEFKDLYLPHKVVAHFPQVA
jgi:hypothetical protein